jgi:tetratricopeptide (TPR) repeat protein
MFISATAQVSEREQQEKEAERKQQLERKTYALVEEIAGGALALKLPENRVFVLSSAAELLWEHDPPRARNLFWDALNTVNLMNTPVTGDSNTQTSKGAKPTPKEKEQTLSQYFEVFRQRDELLQRVARRDPLLALDMLRSSRQVPIDPPEWMRDGYSLPDDRLLEQQIASEAASRNPEQALQLARDSLGKGFSFQLIDLLYRLNQKDADLGTKFAGEVIDKLKTRNIATDIQGSSIAVSLVTLSRPGGATMSVSNRATNRQLKLDEEQRRDLVEVITNAALTQSANATLLYSLRAIMPEIEEFAPERLALIQKKLAAFNQTLSREEKLSDEFNNLTRNGTPEEVLKLAGTAPDNQRDWMQQQAIVMAATRGRADSLREFINTEIADESRRQPLLDALDTEQITLAADRGNTGELQALLPRIRRKEERARAMIGIAVNLQKKGKHDDALKLLDEAQVLIKTDLNNETQTNALLALAGAYALVEPAKAFAIIERTVDRANDDVAKLVLLDKIVRSGMIKKGEIRIQNSGMMPIDFAVFKYGKSVAALGTADFDRTRAAADRFERQELRLMARLLLAQALLRRDDQRY